MKTLVGFIVFFCAVHLSATVRLVPQEYTSIQNAIVASANGDQIRVSDGTYNENIDFIGKAVTVSSLYNVDHNPSHISATIINGTGTGSVVSIISGEDSTSVLSGFTIRNGNYILGGGVSIRNSSPKLMNLVIHSNIGTQAAGVFVSNSSSRLINLTVCDNEGYGIKFAGSSNAELSSSIVYFNTSGISLNSLSTLNYSNVQEIEETQTNISINPMFQNHSLHNYALAAGSPCINGGSPFLPAEADGSQAEMGAIYFANSLPSLYVDFSASETTLFSDISVSVAFTPVLYAFNCTISSQTWSFGNGSTSNLLYPSVLYEPGGYYSVSLTAFTNNGAIVTKVKERYITFYNLLAGGELSGILSLDGSPYYVSEDVVITSTLDVSPGVEIYLNNSPDNRAYILVQGVLNAIGDAENQITIAPLANDGYAGSIIVQSGDVTFSYCNLSRLRNVYVSDDSEADLLNCNLSGFLNYGVFSTGNDLRISNCTITNCGSSSIATINTNALITETRFVGNGGNSIYIMDSEQAQNGYLVSVNNCIVINGSPTTYPAIYVGMNANAIITENQISNGAAGISLNGADHVVINNNLIYNNRNSGIWTEFIGQADIFNNTLHHNTWGIYCDATYNSPISLQGNLIYNHFQDGICLVNSSPLISNNTIVYNSTNASANSAGIWWRETCQPIVVNNILYGNLADLDANEITAGETPTVLYNITEHPLHTSLVDGGSNIVGNPGFISSTDFRLGAGSPAIDTGNPNPVYSDLLEYDIRGLSRIIDGDENGSSVIDRGCYEYSPGNGIHDDALVPGVIELSLYPNPMRTQLYINYRNQDKHDLSQIYIYNLKGQLVRTLCPSRQELETTLIWDGKDNKGRDMAAGVYIIRAKGKDCIAVKKITMLR